MSDIENKKMGGETTRTYMIANMNANCNADRPAYTTPRRISCEAMNGGALRIVTASLNTALVDAFEFEL